LKPASKAYCRLIALDAFLPHFLINLAAAEVKNASLSLGDASYECVRNFWSDRSLP